LIDFNYYHLFMLGDHVLFVGSEFVNFNRFLDV
jgi:hypothetical protein